MCWLTVGWLRPSSWPVTVKLSVSATVTKVRSSTGSNIRTSRAADDVIEKSNGTYSLDSIPE